MTEKTIAYSHYGPKTISRCAGGLYLVSVTLLYHIVVGIQGFDMADEGFSLTAYQQVFNAPESVEYLFLWYLTNIAGGVWNLLFGWAGIFGFRLLTGITMAIIAWIVWNMLYRHLSAGSIMAGFLASLFCSYYGIMVFYHNYLTALLAVCAAATLYRALTLNNMRWMALSGFIVGVNIFVRLPNITLTALILLLIPYYCYHRSWHRVLQFIGAAIGGFIVGIACVLLLMLTLGHWHIFLQAVDSGFSAASTDDSSHQLTTLIGTYLSVYKDIFTIGFFNNTFTVYMMATWGWLWVVCSRRYSREIVYLTTIAIIILHVLPIGSDFGVGNMGENCVYMATPLLTGLVWQAICRCQVRHKVRLLLRIGALGGLSLFLLRGVKNISMQCYFDEGPRWEKTHLMGIARATTFTTARNGELLRPLLTELARYVHEDDILLCFQNSPMLHYLTKTRPYLYNPWPWSYDIHNMEYQFQRAEREHHLLPVVVRDKGSMPHWYVEDPDWDNTHAEDNFIHKNRKVLLIQDFLHRHHYHVVWENEVFQILITKETRNK